MVLADGTQLATRAVVLAMGASYQRLGVPSLESLVGSGVYYGGGVAEGQAMEGQQVYVVGPVIQPARPSLHLAKYADRVTMIVRGDSLGASMSEYLVTMIDATDNVEVHTTVIDGAGAWRLAELVVRDSHTGETRTEPAAALFVFIGAQPHTEWLPDSIQRDDHHIVLTGTDSGSVGADAAGGEPRQPLPLETSLPAVFAAGDVRHGPVKRLVSAVGDGGVSIRSVHQYLAHVRGDS